MSRRFRISAADYSAIIFDFDGVIVDSEDHWGEVESPYIAMHTTGWTEASYSRLIGMLSEVYDLLVAEYNFLLSKQQYFSDYEKLARTLYGEVAMPIQGIKSFLEQLESAKFKAAIASSSKPTWINTSLRRHNLTPYFSAIISSYDSDVVHEKPAPDVYIKAARELDILPDRVIVIETRLTAYRQLRLQECFASSQKSTLDHDRFDGRPVCHADINDTLSKIVVYTILSLV